MGDVVGVRLVCGECFRGEVPESVERVGVEWVGMVCVAGVVRGLGRLAWFLRCWHGNGKYPTEPEKAGGEGAGLRPPHKFSEFLKTFVFGVTSEVHIIIYTTCTASQPYT